MADPTTLSWKTIADALAAKYLAIDGINSATSLPEDAMPSSFPAAIVWPPELPLDEELSADAYDAAFEVEIAFSLEGGTAQMLAEMYTVLDKLVPAFRDGSAGGRVLGLPLLVINSKILSIAPTVVTQWGDGLPGLLIKNEVQVRQVVAPRS